jgi:8-oxo-dGTP pyrophosphatase MutT (NUDIX family)
MTTTTFSIGVGGHQDLGDEATYDFVRHQFRELLSDYKQHNQDIVLYSALAIGADQLFVQIALDMNIPVEVVLPCAEYEKNYPSDEDRHEYRRLLSSSRMQHQLPIQHCSDDAYLAAGQWIVDHSDITILAWNGAPSQGRGGTGDMANYARSTGRPFVHLHTRQHTTKIYGQTIYQGSDLRVNQSHLALPGGEELPRNTVEQPERILVLPLSQGRKDTIVLLTEEYDLDAQRWQLTLPGGKVEHFSPERGDEQAQKELRQEIGYRAGRLERLVSFYSHPGHISQKVHIFLAQDLEWDPLPLERGEAIKIHTFALKDALAATATDYRFDPEAALALWLYTSTPLSNFV